MTTIRQIVYMCLDQARLVSDDTTLNEQHALFLANKVRAALLTQKYKTVKREVADANYQTLCVELEETSPVGNMCIEGNYLRSTAKVPNRLGIGNDLVTPFDYLKGVNISLIPIERMRFVGYNKYLRNIIYAAIDHDGYLCMWSQNPQFKYMQKAKITAVFEDVVDASELTCDKECEVMDREFPIEDSLVNTLVEAVVKELVGAAWRPADSQNNSSDNLSDMAGFIQRNTKNGFQKQIEA